METFTSSERLHGDIRFLGRLLGDTIAEQAGAETLARIETIRRTAMRFRRQQEREARVELEAMLAALDEETCLLSVHAAALFAQLSNIAEDLHLKRLAHFEHLSGRPTEGGVEAALQRLGDAGVPVAAIVATLRAALIVPVLTAHPTEVQRKSILDRQREIAALLAVRDREPLLPSDAARIEEALRRAILTMWSSRLLRPQRITVIDEIDNALDHQRRTFLRQIPRLLIEVEDRLAATGAPGEPELPPLLRIGSWIGSDRDGNPFVTAETLRHAATRRSAAVFEHYLGEIHELGAELSLCTAQTIVDADLAALAAAAHDTSPQRLDEPYRQALVGVYARLAETAQHRQPPDGAHSLVPYRGLARDPLGFQLGSMPSAPTRLVRLRLGDRCPFARRRRSGIGSVAAHVPHLALLPFHARQDGHGARQDGCLARRPLRRPGRRCRVARSRLSANRRGVSPHAQRAARHHRPAPLPRKQPAPAAQHSGTPALPRSAQPFAARIAAPPAQRARRRTPAARPTPHHQRNRLLPAQQRLIRVPPQGARWSHVQPLC